MRPHVVENLLKALVRGLLVLCLLQLDAAYLLEHVSVVSDETTNLHKGVHDLDTDLDSGGAMEHGGKHGDALLGEDAGHGASPAPSVLS